MQYTNLGPTGLQVSRICLGMMTYGDPNWRPWVLPEDDARPFIYKAVEAGINFFDTADMYSRGVSEQVTGKLLKEVMSRDEYVLATKVFFAYGDKPNQGGLSRKHVLEGVDACLKRLGHDYVDHLVIHRHPHGIPGQAETPIEETLEALHDVVKAGKALYLGASSMFSWQFAELQLTAEMKFRNPPEAIMEALEQRLSVQAPRKIGWGLLIVGLAAWVVYLLALVLRNPRWPTIPELLAGGIGAGLLSLFLSVLRQRLLERPHDRYRKVKR